MTQKVEFEKKLKISGLKSLTLSILIVSNISQYTFLLLPAFGDNLLFFFFLLIKLFKQKCRSISVPHNLLIKLTLLSLSLENNCEIFMEKLQSSFNQNLSNYRATVFLIKFKNTTSIFVYVLHF